jgi:hypothetical protein
MGIWQNFEVPNHILIRQAVSLIRKAVPHRHNYADRHNSITYVIVKPTLYLKIIKNTVVLKLLNNRFLFLFKPLLINNSTPYKKPNLRPKLDDLDTFKIFRLFFIDKLMDLLIYYTNANIRKA